MNRNLVNIHFFRSAHWDDDTARCGNHVQIVGDNNVGKSTLLRAMMFPFVARDSSDVDTMLGLGQDSKKSFLSFHFPRHPSYIVYEFTRGDAQGDFFLIVSRPEIQVEFVFVDAPFERGLFLTPAETLRTMSEIKIELGSRGIAFEPTNRYERFHAILYGLDRRHPQYRYFTPLPRVTTVEQIALFPKILSGIYRLGRLDAGQLKTVFQLPVEQVPSIEIYHYRAMLRGFSEARTQIDTYLRCVESSARTQKVRYDPSWILECADDYHSAQRQKSAAIGEFIDSARCFPTAHARLLREIEELTAAAVAESAAIASLRAAFAAEKETRDQRIGGIRGQIQEAERLAAEYRSHRIDRWREQLAGLPAQRGESDQLKGQLSIAEGTRQDARNERDRQVAGARDLYNHEQDELRRLKDELHKRERDEEDAVRRRCEDEARDLNLRYEREEIARRNEKERAAALLKVRSDAVREIEAEPKPALLLALEQKKTQAATAVVDGNREHERLNHQLESLETKHQAEVKVQTGRREALLERGRERSRQLEEARAGAQARIESYERSIAARLQREAGPEVEPVASRVLRREFLDAPAGGLIAAGPATAQVFGYAVDGMALEALDAQSFNLADLSAALSVATAGLETHQAALQAELSGMAESLDAAERMFQREQSALLRRREELRKNIDIARESEEEARERLVVEQRLYDLDRAERLERAKQQERAARDALRDKDSEVDKLRADKKKKLEEHGAETTRAVQAVRTRFAAEAGLLDERQKAARTVFDSKQAEYEQAFLKRLEEAGIDTALISSLKHQIKVLDEAIAEVEKHRDEVVLYSGYKETKIDLLPQRQADLKAEQEALDRLREQVDQNAARHQGELDRLNIQLGKLEKDRERARADAATIDIFGRSGITLHSQGALAAATLAATEPGPFEYGRLDGIWKRIEGADATARDHAEKGRLSALTFLGKFQHPDTGEPHLFSFPKADETLDWLDFADVILRRFVTEKAIESHKKALLARIGGICADVADRIGKMDSAITKVRSSVRRVVDNINVSNQFAAIDSIDMHVSTSSHPLVDALRRTAEFAGIATSAQVDLFSREATNDERGRIIGAVEGLLRELDAMGTAQQFTLSQLYDVEISVTENGVNHGFRPIVDSLGSQGTGSLIKILIYIALIDIYRAEAFDSASSGPAFCQIDEIGEIYAENVASLMRLAREKNIVFACAGHLERMLEFPVCLSLRMEHGKGEILLGVEEIAPEAEAAQA